jgi:hypothetical protein
MTVVYVNWIPWAPNQSANVHLLFVHLGWTSKLGRVILLALFTWIIFHPSNIHMKHCIIPLIFYSYQNHHWKYWQYSQYFAYWLYSCWHFSFRFVPFNNSQLPLIVICMELKKSEHSSDNTIMRLCMSSSSENVILNMLF